jgi:hypothetical protein
MAVLGLVDPGAFYAATPLTGVPAVLLYITTAVLVVLRAVYISNRLPDRWYGRKSATPPISDDDILRAGEEWRQRHACPNCGDPAPEVSEGSACPSCGSPLERSN